MKRSALSFLSVLPLIGQAATEQRPNIILILADDMGYSDIGCYGGEINTPNLDQLAKNGLRYRQFYNGARSCPTRASLLTGLYAHQAGIGWMTAANMGRPAYQGYLNKHCVTLAEVLKGAGYETYMSGKWHVASERQNLGQMQEYWPNQRGFDQFFGIVEGAANYYTPLLNRNNDRFQQKASDDFYLTYALADSAAMFVREHNYQEKPLFMYLAFNAPHWPLHALEKDIAKYRKVYVQGWDKLRKQRFAKQKKLGLFGPDVDKSDRDVDVQAWDSLTDEQRNEFAQRMAIYAAQVDEMDQGIGRVVKALKERGQLDNTIIMFLSDNGACAEHLGTNNIKNLTGKVDTYESYRKPWANLSSTPYKEYKHHTNEGGIATPMIVHYPNGISKKLKGKYSPEFGHIIDIMPTFVELAGAEYPTEYDGCRIQPMEGNSLVPNFSGNTVGRGEVFWEHEGNIAVRDGKWKIVTKCLENQPYDERTMKLYDMEADPTELNDLSTTYPEIKTRLYADWNKWAERVNCLPIETKGYGERQQEYRRNIINGQFNENFGHWTTSVDGTARAKFDIDPNGIDGKSALINVEKSGNRPANVILKWNFRGEIGENIRVSFKVRASQATQMIFRIEDNAHIADKLVEKKLDLTTGVQEFSFTTTRPVNFRTQHQLAFYLGQSLGKVWIDDVTLSFEK